MGCKNLGWMYESAQGVDVDFTKASGSTLGLVMMDICVVVSISAGCTLKERVSAKITPKQPPCFVSLAMAETCMVVAALGGCTSRALVLNRITLEL